jgi:hypothetical protein
MATCVLESIARQGHAKTTSNVNVITSLYARRIWAQRDLTGGRQNFLALLSVLSRLSVLHRTSYSCNRCSIGRFKRLRDHPDHSSSSPYATCVLRRVAGRTFFPIFPCPPSRCSLSLRRGWTSPILSYSSSVIHASNYCAFVVESCTSGTSNQSPLPTGLLPGLKRLRGPVDYMLRLLQNGERFPCLVEVDIRPGKCRSHTSVRPARQNDALALVAKLVPTMKRIRITIALFRETLYPLVASENQESVRSLLNVNSLKLLSIEFTIHRAPALVARWLAPFSALRDVTFSRDFFPDMYDETTKCAFVEQIMVACPQMEYVAIGKRGDLSGL